MKKLFLFLIIPIALLGLLSLTAVAEEEGELLIIYPYGCWSVDKTSPNRGNDYATTTLTVTITDANGNYFDLPLDCDWYLTVDDGEHTFRKKLPAMHEPAFLGSYSFEPCLGQDGLVPVYGGKYAVKLEIYDKGRRLYYSELTPGFDCNILPVLPGCGEMKDEKKIYLRPGAPAFYNTDTRTELAMHIFDAWGMPVTWGVSIDSGVQYQLIYTPTDGEGDAAIVWTKSHKKENNVYYMQATGKKFTPKQGVDYTVTLKVYSANDALLWYSDPTPGFVCDVEGIALPDADVNRLVVTPVGFVNRLTLSGFVAMLTVKVTDSEGQPYICPRGEWTLTLLSMDMKQDAVLYLRPETAENGVYTFAIPRSEGFTFSYGERYIVQVSYYDQAAKAHKTSDLSAPFTSKAPSVAATIPQGGAGTPEIPPEKPAKQSLPLWLIAVIAIGGVVMAGSLVFTIIDLSKKRK